MAALKPIKNGEQIWNDYGPLPRSDLLRRYGYVTENYARYDVVELSTEMMIDVATRSRSMTSEELDARVGDLSLLFAESPLTNFKLQHLNNEFTLEDSYELTHPWTTQSAFPRELLLLLRALTSEQRQVSLKSVSTQHLESLMTREVAHMMREIVIEKQKVYSTTAAQDRALLQDTSVRGLLRMAIEVRLGEKLILEEALEEIGGLQLSAPGDADDSANSESKKRRAEQNTEGLLKRKKV